MFANALRTHSRLRVLTATRVALPATRSISSLVAFRTAVPKNVSLSVSRSFTTSQVARNDYGDRTSTTAGNTIFIANIPWSATEEELGEIFSEFGQVTSVRIHLNPDGRPRGIAHCEFATKESALAAIESASQEPIHMLGRDLRLDFSAGKDTPRQMQHEPSEKLYFSGCSGDEGEIREIFKKFGNDIVDIHLLKDPQSGERIPTGFVQLSSVEAATEAMEALHGTLTPAGDPLIVSFARPRRFQQFGFGEQNRRGSTGSFGGGGNRQGGGSRRASPGWN